MSFKSHPFGSRIIRMEDISVLYYNNKSKTTIYGDFYNVVKSMTNCSFKAVVNKLL